jgi:glyoxylase-like metal-dependent hydrolase (beta-lactamase superfamily II)
MKRLMINRTVQQLEGGLLQIKVPLPFPLRWVNAYVIRGRSGWTLIDPGLHTAESEEVWQQVMAQFDLAADALEQVVLTHHHPDHYGMSGWFQQLSGAPVRISRSGMEQVQAMWGEGETMTGKLLELFRRHGMDAEWTSLMEEHLRGFIPQVSPQPELAAIDESRYLRMGDRVYRPIPSPGHAAGHLCFYDEESAELFCGDHVLPRITPNVSYIPGVDANPLRSYLSSLRDAATWPAAIAYPGHRDPFASFNERAAEIIRHHEDRLQAMEELLVHPMSSYSVCRALFGDRLSVHQLRFALSETIAHMVYLRDEGRIREREQDGVIFYEQSRAS